MDAAQKQNNMKTTPFKMKSGHKPTIAKMMGVSPVKQDKTEKSGSYSKSNPHPMAGSKNAKGTKVIDFMGNWKRINPVGEKK